ncbi:MAG: sialate O-acetylesterase [Planctomycetaceae bacterium]|nr:sialate O-acetylesterase [Planctomycetaceae bacterium]
MSFGKRLAAFVAAWCLSLSVVHADQPTKVTKPERSSFHLYLLIGQSNMAGRGPVEEQDKTPHPRVLTFTRDHEWAPAVDPLHSDKPTAGVGLGSTFGRVMAEANPQVTIGLIPCAVGGTPLSRWQKGGDLWKQAIERAKLAMQDGTLRGVLWHQGEADSGKLETAESYTERLSQMVRDLRIELQTPQVPFVAGHLGLFLKRERAEGAKSYWPLVNSQLDQLPHLVPGTAVVPSTDLQHKGDDVHFDSASLRTFGRRYAEAMQKLQAAASK